MNRILFKILNLFFFKKIILLVLNFKTIDKIIINLLFKKFSKLKLERPEKPRLFWGITPIINFSRWSKSVKEFYISDTIMTNYYSINKKEDYDFYCKDILENNFKNWPWYIRDKYENFFLLYYALKNYHIFHLSCDGLFFRGTPEFKREILLLKSLKKKIVILPYGSDAYMYSKIMNASLRHALLISYPENARNEEEITDRFNFLIKHADCVFSGMFIDGVGRWDVLMPSVYGIDLKVWESKIKYNEADGRNGVVKVMHSPNHRGAKGTEFIINAVNELQSEGLNVELLLIEKVTNDEVRRIMFEDADILAEQLICIGYGLNAIEGMSSGIPVISNLSDEAYTNVFRRYSFLNECPIVSSTPETIKETLRQLITNPQLRIEIGKSGRKYAEKYHPPEIMKFLFKSVYDKIWFGKDVDLINLFNPFNKDSYNNRSCKVGHPLTNNRLPQ